MAPAAQSRTACDSGTLAELQRLALREADECVVGALIANMHACIFAQKRSLARKMFPGCWDIAGGHVEPGETLMAALAREVEEETGWQVTRIVDLVHVFDWQSEEGGKVVKKREFDFLVEVSGDLETPRIEEKKHTEFRWFGWKDIETLKENRAAGDTVIFDLVRAGLARCGQAQAHR